MEQLLLHLIGDYITQTDRMAREKTKDWIAALTHATIYTAPFLLLTQSSLAISVILWSHFLIDRYRLARFIIFAKNWSDNRSLKWSECSATGYPDSMPPWLAFWLLIIADNTMHLCINYASIRWL